MIEEFQQFILQHNLKSITKPILVAVSGGADSVVLCHHFYNANIPFAIAHVNFGLRGAESDADDIFVEGLAQTYEVAHHRKYADTKQIANQQGISIQMAARTIRYNWFEEVIDEYNYFAVAVGTHLNDQIETALLNFSKETGIKGLTGIAGVRNNIFRPLIKATRKSIIDYAEENQLTWRNDSSNDNTYYQRNRIRKEVIPALKEINPSLEKSILKSFHHLKQAEDFLNNQAKSILHKNLKSQGINKLFPKHLIKEPTNSYLLSYWLKPLGFSFNQLEAIPAANQGAEFFSTNGFVLQVERNDFVLAPVTQPNEETLLIEENTETFIWRNKEYQVTRVSSAEYTIKKNNSIGQFDADKLQFPITIRSWQKGDRIKPLGLAGSKKVSDVFIDKKLSNAEKYSALIMVSDMKLAWIEGVVTSSEYSISSTTENFYLLTQKAK